MEKFTSPSQFLLVFGLADYRQLRTLPFLSSNVRSWLTQRESKLKRLLVQAKQTQCSCEESSFDKSFDISCTANA